MRRREFSGQELWDVTKLRHAGASWLSIQEQTSIPRRAAKRAFENWERDQSLEELKRARRDVAAEEFRMHLDQLTGFAQSLVAHLRVPTFPEETRDAEQILEGLWSMVKREELSPYRQARAGDGQEGRSRQVVRQNRMLFRSLQAHTDRKKLLEGWEEAWNCCVQALARLQAEAHEVLTGILNQKPGLKDRIEQGTGKKDAVERMKQGILWSIWADGALGKLDQADLIVDTISQSQGTIEITFGKRGHSLGLRFADKNLADEVAKVCRWAARNLCEGEGIRRMAAEFGSAKEEITKIEAMLDPLILRPLILRTRCDLCPV